MARKTAEEIQGYEYDWLACDENGHVALFSTAGGGFAPPAFLEDTDIYDRAIDAIQALPIGSEAVRAPQVKDGRPNIWKEMALRGVYAFDADANGGPYRLVGIPSKPIWVGHLPKSVADVVKIISFSNLQFAVFKIIARNDIVRNATQKCFRPRGE
jgi:hypothetical protein